MKMSSKRLLDNSEEEETDLSKKQINKARTWINFGNK